MSIVQVACPRGVDHSAVHISQHIQWIQAASREMMVLKFTRKAPVNIENLFYFCGGYVDPQTRWYYSCPCRTDALFPLFSIDEIMPEGSATQAESLIKTITVFTADYSDAFMPVFEEQGLCSVVAHPDLFPLLLEVIDRIAQKRRALNELFEQIDRCRYGELIPEHMRLSFSSFCDGLGFAKHHWKNFVATWANVEVGGNVGSAISAKLVALFDLVAYRKIDPAFDYTNHDRLRELHKAQLKGELEDEIMMVELMGEEA